MKRALSIALLALTLFGEALSQAPENLRINADATFPGAVSISWFGVSGKTYFVQFSDDLLAWTYFPDFILTGTNAPIVSDALFFEGFDQLFIRLQSTPMTASNPFTADFDGDKVSNYEEAYLNSDPLHFADSDGDGIPNDWETKFGLNPADPNDANGDADGDGISNSDEYVTNTDPTDYYNATSIAQLPTLLAISGNGQTGEWGTISAGPLVVELRMGGVPLANRPFTAEAVNQEGGADSTVGRISLASNGTGLATKLFLQSGADGRAQIYFRYPWPDPSKRFVNFVVGSASELGVRAVAPFLAESTVLDAYSPGTVGWNASHAIDSRLVAARINGQVGQFAPTAKLIFSTQNHTTSTYVRNTAAWCYDHNQNTNGLTQAMTCISPWNGSGAGSLRAGTAITAQHIITAAHFPLFVTNTVRFITADNAVVTRTIRGTGTFPEGSVDLMVYTLDSPLPANITPCKVLPDNYASYLSFLDAARPPALMLDQEEKALVANLRALTSDAEFAIPDLRLDRLAFYEDLVFNDSSNPAFLIVDREFTVELVLLSTHHTGGPGKGSFARPSALNTMIARADADATARWPDLPPVNTGLQVEAVNLSSFDGYTAPNPP